MGLFILLFLALCAPSSADEGIAWYGTWKGGLEAARISQAPIFLTSAAPQCHGVSGLW